MFNLRIISVCLGHTGLQIKRWVPLTSNLLKWKSKLHFHWDFQDNFLCQSIFFCFVFPNSPRLVWDGLIFFTAVVDPFLTLHWDPLLFVGWACWVAPTGSGSSFPPPPPQEGCGTFHTSYSGTGWRVCGTLMCPEQHFDCSGVGLYNFEECLDFLHLVDYSLDPA